MEMEGERTGMVLLRASELHSKIATCFHNSSRTPHFYNVDDDESSANKSTEDADSLLAISDSFVSLQSLLSSFQSLQQQQQYEREAVIRDIEYNRKLLLKKLSEYKGEYLDVIREAEAFASTKVGGDNELLLPPYPTRGPNSLVLDTSLRSRFSNARKVVQNGHDSSDESKKSQIQNSSNKLLGGLRFLVSSTVKTIITLVGVISLLSLAGFEPKLKKKGRNFMALALYGSREKRQSSRCPPGKVAVVENGEIHCIVKERVEIPFDYVAADPDVNYGCG